VFDLISSAYAMGAPPAGGGEPSPIASLLPFALMFLVLYLLILRPQMKKQKQQQQMIDELEKGDQVVTSGGIHGLIQNIKDDIIVLKIAENVKIELSRSAVSRVVNKEDDSK
jgi:preprotein translocase subunit YajC